MSIGYFIRLPCFHNSYYSGSCQECINEFKGNLPYNSNFHEKSDGLKPHLCPKCDGNGMTIGQYSAHVECNVCKGKGVLWG